MEVLKIALVRLIDIIVWFIIAKSIMSWFPGAQDSKLYALLDDLTEPVEAPMRKLMSRFNTGPLDMSPMLAIIFLWIISRLIYTFL
nr:YggT family protein [uncultured Peptostreptococcus sp.]